MIMAWSKQLSEVILYALESCDPFFNNMHVCVLQFSRVSLFLRTLLLVHFVTIKACSQGCSKYATTSHAQRKIICKCQNISFLHFPSSPLKLSFISIHFHFRHFLLHHHSKKSTLSCGQSHHSLCGNILLIHSQLLSTGSGKTIFTDSFLKLCIHGILSSILLVMQ